MPIITVSRQLGAGGADIAVGVVKALSPCIFMPETFEEAAREVGAPQIALLELGYEGRMGAIQCILDPPQASPVTPCHSASQLR